MFCQHAMHGFVTQYFCEVINPRTALPILKQRSTDVERARFSILAVLKVTSVVLAMRDGDGTNLPVRYRIPQQVGQVWRLGDGLSEGCLSPFRKVGVFAHLQQQWLNPWVNRRHASPPSIWAPYTHSRFVPPAVVS